MTRNMKPYIVLYRQEAIMAPSDPPFGFACWADDADHAEEQCMNCYPDSDVVWVYRGVGVDTRFDYQDALNDYFTEGMSK